MRPDRKSNRLLGVTRSKAKMIEYHVPEEYQEIDLSLHPNKLFTISIGLLGDLAAAINRVEPDPDSLAELKNNLLFSARFFDSYLQSKLNETLDPYLVLLGSASFYLCDLPGSASVLAKRIDGDCPDLDGDSLEDLLLWLLQADLGTYFDGAEGPFGGFIDGISKWILQFFEDGNGEKNLLDLAMKLRDAVYEFGTPRQLLFGDVIAAVLRKKLENSAWKALPSYSGLPRDKWLHALQKDSFIKELWPAQHLLGQADVLKGESAIIQMPTSAGKTKATELILRSAFLADRVSLAIIIAPFRALCHEIKNSLVEAFHNEPTRVDELSDALQTDFEIAELLGHKQILVITPEKLLYVLRHAPELAAHVGLLVFDEGHQFDSGTRGITYELLLTSLRSMIPEGTQKVLISAVISNAEAVGEWLNGEPNVVEGTTLIPTFRSVGFASWLDQLGRIEYVDSRDAEQGEFFVPRVIERFNLGKRGREQKERHFPERDDGQAIALYLGIKLAPNGSIAIFCGKKSTATSICEKAVEFIDRGIPFPLPQEFSDRREVERLHYLHAANLGPEASASMSAEHGIFSHHGNTPHGIRLSVEHAMRENLVRFVVCTSTLAQGVNLPIRYLIVTSVYQGMERIKVRDFHNLIGRAGRAGMHTEGSILFADPIVYDKRRDRKDGWRWDIVKELLDPTKSEECASSLFQLIPLVIRNDRTKSKDKKNHSLTWDILSFAKAHIAGWDSLNEIITKIAKQYGGNGFTVDAVKPQFEFFSLTLASIEGFLLSNWDAVDNGLTEEDIADLAEQTLAYFLADDEKREQIQELFKLLAENISENITDVNRRKAFGKTLYGVNDAKAIEGWVQDNADELLDAQNGDEALDLVWPLIMGHVHNKAFNKFDKKDVLKEITKKWISGTPFHQLFRIADNNKCKLGKGKRPRKVKIENIIDICEGGLAYDGALLVSALCEFVEMLDREGTGDPINRLQIFQKRLKYGLPTETTIALYELGFSDRVIAQDLAASLNLAATQKKDLVKALKKDRDGARAVMEKYPSYFQERMNELL
ncbi:MULTISPECIES: DEAD/DEAH box helicase [Gammaproteobacteria]|uniref:DEAD/DEAH box helicase n=1 Tax=Gammaproteobacteria TaxID=1236 RepID=UPI0002511A9E|nr:MULTISPECIES: DEAD/DEAH box helicase [Gammaproteobacteria]EFB7856682.1 DEAD/DEAH box helicase [Escherichia coli]EHX75588.1 DEAD/DEAH box helicase family protein [Escherichia coli DEC14B]EHX85229.1 DEAD/DEAH box helicase family protein [Escherichia coli DEC14C]EFH3961938.1 DEAD/DEAH box helicase [Escherichia coli]EFH5177081.1 DEAD/DEAH box helicase [Escherichia coli]